MSEAPLLRLRDVRKRHGDGFTLDIGRLEVEARTIMCLLGPTGAGKSTLLRLLAGVEQPTSGTLLYRAAPHRFETLSPRARRSVTLVFQRPLMLSGTVRWNVEYGLRLRAVADAAKVERMLDRLGLTGLARQRAGTLSGGQTQLVALARALVLEPEVLLLDEPTANLDRAHVDRVERVVLEECLARRITAVWATHNLFQARRVAHTIALILDGRLVEMARADRFFDSPRDPRTRDFVEGRMVY